MDNVILRNPNANDVDFILNNWAKEKKLPNYNFKNSKTRKEILELINQWNTKSYNGMYFEMYIIEVNNSIAGLLSLYQHDTDNISIGISLQKDFQNQGIATNAIKIITAHLKSSSYINLVSQCRIDNIASVALHKKCGFQMINKKINSKSHEVFIWKLHLK